MMNIVNSIDFELDQINYFVGCAYICVYIEMGQAF